jgi:putative transposase
MRKVYKFRLLSTKKQVQRLNWTLDMCRILYNSCLLDRRRYYDQTGKGLTRIRQQEILKSDKQRIAHLKEIHSRVLQDVLFRVDRAFQAFFVGGQGGREAWLSPFQGGRKI